MAIQLNLTDKFMTTDMTSILTSYQGASQTTSDNDACYKMTLWLAFRKRIQYMLHEKEIQNLVEIAID